MRRGWWLAFVSAVATAVVVGVFTAGSVSAATSVFCTDSSSDQAMLDGAIAGGGTVLVHGTCLGNWTIATGVTLTGVGGATLMGAGGGSVLTVIFSSASVTINTLTITGGNGSFGAGVQVLGSTVFINNSKIVGNNTGIGGGGLAEFFGSFVSLTGTSVSGNSAVTFGGGIYTSESFTTITNSSIASNTVSTSASFGVGGGIALFGGSVSLTGSRVVANAATPNGEGGGIGDFDGGQLGEATLKPAVAMPAKTLKGPIPIRPNLPSGQLAHATAQPNQAVVLPPIGLTLTNTTVDHNQASLSGGGILNFALAFDSPVTITNSAITNNTASVQGFGGGIANAAFIGLLAQLTITGSQIRGNLARNGVGGGIYNQGVFGTALVSLAGTSLSQASGTLNPNQAQFGGGIYNTQFSDGAGDDGVADVSLQGGGSIVRNKAATTGGGVFNDCGATFSQAPGSTVLLNTPNNIVNSPLSVDVFGEDCVSD
jgi:predicted outer membrane repeat protein